MHGLVSFLVWTSVLMLSNKAKYCGFLPPSTPMDSFLGPFHSCSHYPGLRLLDGNHYHKASFFQILTSQVCDWLSTEHLPAGCKVLDLSNRGEKRILLISGSHQQLAKTKLLAGQQETELDERGKGEFCPKSQREKSPTRSLLISIYAL